MNQLSTSEKDLGFGTIGSKNGGIPNISKIGENTRPVGGVHIVAHYCIQEPKGLYKSCRGGVKDADHHCTL